MKPGCTRALASTWSSLSGYLGQRSGLGTNRGKRALSVGIYQPDPKSSCHSLYRSGSGVAGILRLDARRIAPKQRRLSRKLPPANPRRRLIVDQGLLSCLLRRNIVPANINRPGPAFTQPVSNLRHDATAGKRVSFPGLPPAPSGFSSPIPFQSTH